METLPSPLVAPSPEVEPGRFRRTVERVGEIKDVIVDEASFVYHGLKAAIADKRAEWAGNRMEKMEHKDALYTDLGNLAIRGERTVSDTASGNTAMPRTRVERFMDRRLSRQSEKKRLADYDQAITMKYFGFEGNLSSKTKKDKRQELRQIKRQQKRGELLASEALDKAQRTRAEHKRLGKDMFVNARSRQIRKAENLEDMTKQPVLSRWRNWRRNEAIKDVQRHRRRANKHNEKARVAYRTRNE